MNRLVSIIMMVVGFCGCTSGPNWKRQAFAFSQPTDPLTTNTTQNIVGLSRVSISPIFQNRSFTYRTGENSYEQDPYAGFLISPGRALAESIRAWMRASDVYGRVVDPGSGLTPNVIVEVSINELYGDFRKASKPVGTMGVHVICCEVQDDQPSRVILDRSYSHETPLAQKTPAALMAAWDTDLREIMNEINAEYAKANSRNTEERH